MVLGMAISYLFIGMKRDIMNDLYIMLGDEKMLEILKALMASIMAETPDLPTDSLLVLFERKETL